MMRVWRTIADWQERRRALDGRTHRFRADDGSAASRARIAGGAMPPGKRDCRRQHLRKPVAIQRSIGSRQVSAHARPGPGASGEPWHGRSARARRVGACIRTDTVSEWNRTSMRPGAGRRLPAGVPSGRVDDCSEAAQSGWCGSRLLRREGLSAVEDRDRDGARSSFCRRRSSLARRCGSNPAWR